MPPAVPEGTPWRAYNGAPTRMQRFHATARDLLGIPAKSGLARLDASAKALVPSRAECTPEVCQRNFERFDGLAYLRIRVAHALTNPRRFSMMNRRSSIRSNRCVWCRAGPSILTNPIIKRMLFGLVHTTFYDQYLI
jgi:hypothetical protein